MLFAEGKSKSAYPVKMITRRLQAEAKPGVKAMFVVPKKKFKHANDRNKLKRRMREAYRLQKTEFYTLLGPTAIDIAFIYYANKSEDYATIYQAFNKLLTSV